jgi:hypothetical protein
MADRDVKVRLEIDPRTEKAQQAIKGLAGEMKSAGERAGGKGGLNLAGMVPGGGALGGLLGGGGGALAVGGPWGALAAGALEAGKALASMTAKANPAVMERLSMAVDDAQAVIGQRFAPVIELVTEGVRVLGDFLASALPSTGEVRAALQEFKPVIEEVKANLALLAPIIKTGLSVALKAVAVNLQIFAKVLEPVTWAMKGLGDVLGGDKKSSVGAAARQAQQFGDLNAALEANNQLALSGSGFEEQQVSILGEISNKISDVLKAMGAPEPVAKGTAKGLETGAVFTAMGGPVNPLAWAYLAYEGLKGL